MEAAMAFPDRIERTVELAHPPAAVWAALTTAEGLGAWFGNEAAIDLRPGGPAWMRWDGGHTAEMRVERVEAPAVFGFTWHIYGLPGDDPRRTYVEFTLEPAGAGTRLAAGGPATATDLAGRLPVTRQAIAKHLALLAGAGLVRAEPGERRRVRYRLHSAPMQIAQQFLAALARDWDAPLVALKDHLDRDAGAPAAAPTGPEDVMADQRFTPGA